MINYNNLDALWEPELIDLGLEPRPNLENVELKIKHNRQEFFLSVPKDHDIHETICALIKFDPVRFHDAHLIIVDGYCSSDMHVFIRDGNHVATVYPSNCYTSSGRLWHCYWQNRDGCLPYSNLNVKPAELLFLGIDLELQ